MKRALILLLVVVGTIVVIDVLADATQSRPDEVRADEVTELVLDVDVDRFHPGEAAAAAALWAVCAAQTRSRPTTAGGPEAIGDGRYRLVLAPAVGEHDQRKLVGCLEDLTIDRVRGDVEVLRDAAAERQPATYIRP
jgi:hypothetical protein